MVGLLGVEPRVVQAFGPAALPLSYSPWNGAQGLCCPSYPPKPWRALVALLLSYLRKKRARSGGVEPPLAGSLLQPCCHNTSTTNGKRTTLGLAARGLWRAPSRRNGQWLTSMSHIVSSPGKSSRAAARHTFEHVVDRASLTNCGGTIRLNVHGKAFWKDDGDSGSRPRQRRSHQFWPRRMEWVFDARA